MSLSIPAPTSKWLPFTLSLASRCLDVRPNKVVNALMPYLKNTYANHPRIFTAIQFSCNSLIALKIKQVFQQNRMKIAQVLGSDITEFVDDVIMERLVMSIIVITAFHNMGSTTMTTKQICALWTVGVLGTCTISHVAIGTIGVLVLSENTVRSPAYSKSYSRGYARM